MSAVKTRFMRDPMESMVPTGGGGGDGTYVELGRIGHEDQNPEWMTIIGQSHYVEVMLRDGEEIVARVGESVHDLAMGDTVVVVFVDGDPQQAVVTSRVHDNAAPLPASVAGVSTGAAPTSAEGVTAPARTFHFVRTRDGRCFALETGAGGDILLHSGAGVHVKAETTHIEGTVHLGAGPVSGPTGSVVAPANGETPGVPMVPRVPVPLVNTTIPPYGGDRDAVVRASDEYQSNITIDSIYWTKMLGLETMLLTWANLLPLFKPAHDIYVAIPVPVKIDSKAKTASPRVTAGG